MWTPFFVANCRNSANTAFWEWKLSSKLNKKTEILKDDTSVGYKHKAVKALSENSKELRLKINFNHHLHLFSLPLPLSLSVSLCFCLSVCLSLSLSLSLSLYLDFIPTINWRLSIMMCWIPLNCTLWDITFEREKGHKNVTVIHKCSYTMVPGLGQVQ